MSVVPLLTNAWFASRLPSIWTRNIFIFFDYYFSEANLKIMVRVLPPRWIPHLVLTVSLVLNLLQRQRTKLAMPCPIWWKTVTVVATRLFTVFNVSFYKFEISSSCKQQKIFYGFHSYFSAGHSNKDVTPSSKVVEYYVERGCKRDSPIFAAEGLSKTYSDWSSITLTDKNYGIKGSLSAQITTRDTGIGLFNMILCLGTSIWKPFWKRLKQTWAINSIGRKPLDRVLNEQLHQVLAANRFHTWGIDYTHYL